MRAALGFVVVVAAACSTFSEAKDPDIGAEAGSDAGPSDATTEAPVGPAPFASDSFERAIAVGFGNADLGGAWTMVTASGTSATVGEGSGNILLKAGASVDGYLAGIRELDVDHEITFRSSEFGRSESASYLSVAARHNGTAQYQCTAKVQNDGEVVLVVSRDYAGGTALTERTSGIKLVPNDAFRLRVVVQGTNPTTIRCKAWRAAFAEPTGWPVEVTDSTMSLQARGDVGLRLYLSQTATVDTLVRVDDYVARPPGRP